MTDTEKQNNTEDKNVDKKMMKAPSTKMGLNSLSAEHHMRYAASHNSKVLEEKNLKDLERSIKNKTRYLSEFETMKKKNENDIEYSIRFNLDLPRKWYKWNLYQDGVKEDMEDFKSLCRVVMPKGGLIGKSVEEKKKAFEKEKISELQIMSKKERMELELREEIREYSTMKDAATEENADVVVATMHM